jgi:murein DD-endopeptidase MepM/ murein hydrolase activator NlpD
MPRRLLPAVALCLGASVDAQARAPWRLCDELWAKAAYYQRRGVEAEDFVQRVHDMCAAEGPPRDLVEGLGGVPVAGILTSGFGLRRDPFDRDTYAHHAGVDISAPMGTPVYAAAAGRVVGVGPRGSCGLSVRIEHEEGLQTVYCHLSSILVEQGDQLSRGEELGAVGSSGRSTGPHLHYAVSLDGRLIDPLTHPTLAPELGGET